MNGGIYITSGASLGGLAQVLGDVGRERTAQDEKWGLQLHADGTGPRTWPLFYGIGEIREASFLAERFRAACQENGTPESPDTWAAILLEEVFEALAEDDPTRLRRELVQVAAVAVQWVERIDERTGASS